LTVINNALVHEALQFNTQSLIGQ